MEIQSEGSSMLEAGLTCLIWLSSDFRDMHEEAPHTGSLGETDCGEGTWGALRGILLHVCMGEGW